MIWWRCEGKEKLLLGEAQRLVRIQREIARGFHRQVDCSRQILQHAENILQQWCEAEHP